MSYASTVERGMRWVSPTIYGYFLIIILVDVGILPPYPWYTISSALYSVMMIANLYFV